MEMQGFYKMLTVYRLTSLSANCENELIVAYYVKKKKT